MSTKEKQTPKCKMGRLIEFGPEGQRRMSRPCVAFCIELSKPLRFSLQKCVGRFAHLPVFEARPEKR